MLPAPTTIASSTPRDWMSTSSSAIDSIVARSMPYSLGPISASPESFRRIRPNAGAALGVATAPSGSGSVIGSAREREPFELQHLGARLGQRLSDRLTGVVDPGLLGQDPRREEALVQHAVDDLLARLLGLGIDLVRIRIDLALCRDDVLRHVLAAHPLRGGRGDVHRNEPAELGVASAHLDERAQLVRGGVRIAGDPAAVDGLEARGADDRDVLAQLRNEVDALVLELRECVDAFGIHELQRLLCKRLEVVAVRDEVGFTAQRHDRPLRRVARERVADLALRRLTVGALGGLPEALLAQELLRRLDVTTRVDERSLGVHHPRPGQVAELLDERGGDGGHDWASSVLWAAAGSTLSSPCDSTSCSGASATSSAAGAGASATSSAVGSGASATSSAAGSGAGSGASSAAAPFPLGLGRANSSAVTADWPAAIPSAIARMTSEHERIASSLPGITKSASSGSQLVSTRATTGRPSRRASRTASCSLQVDDEHGVRLLAHVGDAAEVRLELLQLAQHRDPLLRGEQLDLALVLEPAQLVQPLDAARDRAPVRQQPAQPAVVDVRHLYARRLFGDRVLALFLRAHEQDRSTAAGDVAGELVGGLEQVERLLEVDDVDAAALREDEALHLRVPAAGLVAEMDSRLQKLSHAYDRHCGPFLG